MNNITLNILLVIGLALIITGCVPDTAVPATLAITRVAVVGTNTAVASPTATTTPTATIDPTPETTLSPTPTRPTVTPRPTSTPTPRSNNPPAWVSDPTVNVLLLRNKDGGLLTLFNANTGEQVEMNAGARNLLPTRLWQESIDFRQDFVSPDGRYAARIIEREGDTESVLIIDRETSTETELVNPFLHVQTLDETFNEYAIPSWSPDGTFLSVVYEKHYYSDNSDWNLVIYTPTGEIYRQYADISLASLVNPWVPVRPYRIFYTDRSQACVIEIVENMLGCFEAINEWLADRDIVLLNRQWSPDGERISYIYDTGTVTPDMGLCYFELTTENIVCPITATDLYFDEQMFPRITFWSPDGKYLALFFDDFGYSEHVFGSVSVATVSIESQALRFMDGSYSWSFVNPWRLPIATQSEE